MPFHDEELLAVLLQLHYQSDCRLTRRLYSVIMYYSVPPLAPGDCAQPSGSLAVSNSAAETTAGAKLPNYCGSVDAVRQKLLDAAGERVLCHDVPQVPQHTHVTHEHSRESPIGRLVGCG
jgi:hypothetical protein